MRGLGMMPECHKVKDLHIFAQELMRFGKKALRFWQPGHRPWLLQYEPKDSLYGSE